MKLLSKPDAKLKIKKSHEELVVSIARLKRIYGEWLIKINNVKTEYSRDEKAKEYDSFCAEILAKKSGLLKELKDLQDEIENKRGVIDGLIAKSDELTEREYEVQEKETKLSLREDFIRSVENKMYGR